MLSTRDDQQQRVESPTGRKRFQNARERERGKGEEEKDLENDFGYPFNG